MSDLAGRRILVTGASSGLGRHIAGMLAGEGAEVVAVARRIDALRELAASAEGLPGRIHPAQLDVSDVGGIETVLDAAEAEVGPIEALVNNAGVPFTGRATATAEADFDRVFDTNVKGAFFVATAVGRRMIDRKIEGRVLNVGSVAGLVTMPQLTAYCMSKAAVVHMTRCLAREWARYRINVNALCPGYVATELNADYLASEAGQRMEASLPRGRFGVPGDLDGAVRLLLAGEAGRLINGAVVAIDDGYAVS